MKVFFELEARMSGNAEVRDEGIAGI